MCYQRVRNCKEASWPRPDVLGDMKELCGTQELTSGPELSSDAQGWTHSSTVLLGLGKEGTAVAGLTRMASWGLCPSRKNGSLPRLEAYRTRAVTWKGLEQRKRIP